MRKATELLVEEHDLIEKALALLEKASDWVESGKDVDPEIFLQLGEFIRSFADRCHHAKEEDLLFKRMEQRGIPREGGPIGQMLLEHDEGRRYTRAMVAAAEQWKTDGDRSRAVEVAQNARKYAELLRQHIFKENNILYPMGERFLSERDFAELEAEFARVEREVVGEGVHEKYAQLVEHLERRFQPEPR